MQKLPLGEAVGTHSNSPSPFAHLKESPDSKLIGRTQSLDEGCRRMFSSDECADEKPDNENSVVTALHTSFDASLLEEDNEHDEARFPVTSAGKRHASNASTENLDIPAPGTVRKLRRRSDVPPGTRSTTGTLSHSMRPQAKKGDRTPTSASRRRRTHQRRSPHRHQSCARIPPTATPVPFKFQEAREDFPATPRVSLFGTTTQLKPPPQLLTPTKASRGLPQALAANSATKLQQCDTGTTVNSSFDAMNETDNHGTSSPTSTPFRFTSFPASLPRVNNPRTVDRNYRYPPSTRKYMSFSAFASGEDEAADEENRTGPVQPLHLSRNSSHEDDGTQSSSLSSLSATDALREGTASSFQPKTLDWKSPGNTDMKLDRKNSADSGGHESRPGAATSIQSKLFANEDDLTGSPKTVQSLKTRLNFNHMISPSKQIMFDKVNTKEESHVDLSRPYEQRKTRSFPSTASSTTSLRNISGFEDADSGTTPSRLRVINIADHENPLSPEQVKFHFHVDASQCSPIPGIPEEACDRHTAMDIEGPVLELRSPRPIRERPPRSAPRKRSQRLLEGQAGPKKHESDERELSRLSVSNESGDGGSSTSSKIRKRPMPDMSAFDAGVSTRSASSRNDRSTDESSGAMESRAVRLSPQLVCPPTPERTPVWAQSEKGPHPKYTWQNSLITTKVLATCPAQVLDGHSSLENSLMDDADDTDEFLFGRRPSMSYSAIEEDLEGGDSEESPIRDLSELQEMFLMPPSARYQPPLTRTTSVPLAKFAPPPLLVATTSCIPRVPGFDTVPAKASAAKTPFLPKGSVAKTPASPPTQETGSFGGVGSVISFSADFVNLGKLGSGAFADVYKVRSKADQQLYAVKRNRRHFRGKRDREMAMAEVRIMQRLQSVCAERGMSSPSETKKITKNSYSLYLLFFFRAWQEDGHFFCQTELCCRDTCREMKLALGSEWPVSQKKYPSLLRYFPAREGGHLVPENTVWKICHDVAAGLSHIHSHGVVHNDIKPSNIFLVPHNRLGAMLKIGDFGMAGDVGTSEDGQEGDTSYMAPELLSSGARHPSADIFSLGLTLYELASTCSWELPSEGSKWQELRNGSHSPDLPRSRCPELSQLIKAMINPDPQRRPSADDILQRLETVEEAGNRCDDFLQDYIKDIEEYDRIEEERLAMDQLEADERGRTPRNASGRTVVREFGVRSPTLSIPFAPALFTPEPASTWAYGNSS